MAQHDDHAAIKNGAPLSKKIVRKPSTRYGCEVHHRRVHGVNWSSLVRTEAQTAFGHRGRHEKHEDRAHAVITETFPHLGEKESGQTTRLTQKPLVAGARHDAHGL